MIDDKDQKIISALVEDGRASVESISEIAGLSPTPTRRRIQQLEKEGLITGYKASIDPEKCGLELCILAFVKLQKRDRNSIAEFESEVFKIPEILKCDLITGTHDYILTIRLPSMNSYNRFLRHVLAELPGIFGIETSVVIGNVKDTDHLPLNTV
ncbi:MAG: Lrp/AsnC family transcriptional regulator [Pseudomonadota bacterium]